MITVQNIRDILYEKGKKVYDRCFPDETDIIITVNHTPAVVMKVVRQKYQKELSQKP
jgi:hypothetical protein